MTEHIKDGGPAFPVEHYTQSRYESTGISVRDYFAAKAMQAVIGVAHGPFEIGVNHTDTNLNFAKVAYALADAMLAAREKQP